MRPLKLTVLAFALGLFILASPTAPAPVPTSVTAEALAHQIEARMLGDFTAENLRVEAVPFDDQSYTQQGRVQWIMFTADSLTQKPITIRDVFVKALDVTLDLDKLFTPAKDVVTVSLGRSIVGARITEEDLNTMVGPGSAFAEQSGMENLKMELTPGQIKISGNYRPLFGSEIELTGTLEVEERRRVNFLPLGAKLNGMPLPKAILKAVLKRLNPLIDFDTVPLGPTVEEVTILEGEVRVVG